MIKLRILKTVFKEYWFTILCEFFISLVCCILIAAMVHSVLIKITLIGFISIIFMAALKLQYDVMNIPLLFHGIFEVVAVFKAHTHAETLLKTQEHSTITMYVSRKLYTIIVDCKEYVSTQGNIKYEIDPYRSNLEYGFTKKNELISDSTKFFD